MYYGIEVVSKPVHQWGIEELREFIDKNGEYLADRPLVSMNEGDLQQIGRDFERIAGMLATICEDTEASSEINRLNQEVADLDRDLGRLERENETYESCIGELEDKISSLEEQLANREE